MYTLKSNWKLAMDPCNEGRAAKWFEAVRFDAVDVPVPGVIQQAFPGKHGVAWYWNSFQMDEPVGTSKRGLLRFGAVDYMAEVWLNGKAVGGHEGGETPFVLDVTDALRSDCENLLVVRVLNPTDEPIDGIRIKEVPGLPGLTCGGIVLPVEFEIVPMVRISDVAIESDWKSGELRVSVTIHNDISYAVAGRLCLSVESDKTGGFLSEATAAVDCGPEETDHKVCLIIKQHRLWELTDPFLYRVRVVLNIEAVKCTHERMVRFGFRDFRVNEGFFYLNGRRIYLRTCHTAAYYPVTLSAPDPDLMRRDLIYAKACGFNCVRFIAKMALPEQLDLCDEIGVMVYEEPLGSWWLIGDQEGGGYAKHQSVNPAMMTDPEITRKLYENSFRQMILRDRNHPCITIWGMLNEQPDGRLFRMAVETLKLIRSLDSARLVLLDSGRTDSDISVGSLCNPGSAEWEQMWGAEGVPEPSYRPFSTNDQNGPDYICQGDFHAYPKLPLKDEDKVFLRTLGEALKPVFISEGGFGNMVDFIGQLRRYEQAGTPADAENFTTLRPLPEKLNSDLKCFGMEEVYPFPQDIMRESQRLNLRQRRLWFDLVRSNPNICGNSLTSMLEFTAGEGFWDAWREMHPGIADVLRDGWAPLRWCLFADPVHGYAGRPIRLEAVLANEDVLQPGDYLVHFRVWGLQGIVWEKRIVMRLPATGKYGLPPLAVQVLDENIDIDLPAGEYTFAANLESGGAPAGDRMQFLLSDEVTSLKLKTSVTIWGIDERVCEWLALHGVHTRTLSESHQTSCEIILVGKPEKSNDNGWREVMHRINEGAVAVFMEPEAFEPSIWLPCPLRRSDDWLYHKEYVAKAHVVMNGLQSPGMLDPDYYGSVFAPVLFDKEPLPVETIVACFTSGQTYLDPLYASGVAIGRYSMGKGEFILNAFNVLSNIDRHPVADRLLFNLI